MSKPINVEAQRVAKIISDTEVRLQTLSLLSADFFSEIRKYNKEELKSMFGADNGRTLFLEAESEQNFVNENIVANVMEPLNSELLQADQRLRAKKHARDINK